MLVKIAIDLIVTFIIKYRYIKKEKVKGEKMKKFKKILLSLALGTLVIAGLSNVNVVRAESAGPLYLGIGIRNASGKVLNIRDSGYGYEQGEKKVWKINTYDNTSDLTADTSNLIYCIKAGAGFGTATGDNEIKPYTQRFNLKDSSSITTPYNSALPQGTNYNKLLWIIDHIYTQIGNNDATARNTFLSNVIPSERYELLNDDDVDVVQQLAIWYFTNPSGDYHYDNIELYINATKGTDDDYKSLEDFDTTNGWDRQDAAKALYTYFINNASATYTPNSITTKPVELIKSNAKMIVDGTNYIAGPYKINKLLDVDYMLTATYKNYGTSDAITPTIVVKDASGNYVTTTKTLKDLVGTEFYLQMPTSSKINGIDMTINSSYSSRTATYWSVENAPSTEQPVVLIKYSPLNFSDETTIVIPSSFDLSLRKFITEVNGIAVPSREPQVDVKALAAGTATTATYNHTKSPIKVQIGDIVTYTIRVYNEGNTDGYVTEITDHLPANLKAYTGDPTNDLDKFNATQGWLLDKNDKTERTVRTAKLSKANEITSGANKIAAFDGTKLDYRDVKIKCKVVATDPMPSKITNIADITGFTDGNGNIVTDRDSQENNVQLPADTDLPAYNDAAINRGEQYIPGQQDDDDFEKVAIEEFDLSLRKFITKINDSDVKTRIPVVDVTKLKDKTNTTATYTHSKDPVLVTNGAIVTYTIRVYNEGDIAGYASKIKDDIPEGLEYLPDNTTNKEYRWMMLDKDGKEVTDITKAVSISTDYLSKEQGEARMAKDATIKTNPSLTKAFDGTALDYKDVQVAFKVTEPSTSDRIITNQAQISDDKDENGKDVTDRDSTPDKWIEGEDDQDIEKLKVQYFDLALRKWVTQAIVLDNGQTTVTETGHKAEDDPEGIVKVDLKQKKISSVTVKFRYKIRVVNEGKIAGYVKEIKDYIPDGLKFVQEDNPTWTAIDDQTITTDQAKDILLEPGQSTEVEVLLTWINGENNLGLKVNVAEISKDYNEFNAKDIDSTPDNHKEGEDDIDSAPVLLSVQTGQVRTYATISGIVLLVIGIGVILIKKFVI